MNSIYNTATAAARNYESEAYNQTEPQNQWRRNRSQQQGHPGKCNINSKFTLKESNFKKFLKMSEKPKVNFKRFFTHF